MKSLIIFLGIMLISSIAFGQNVAEMAERTANATEATVVEVMDVEAVLKDILIAIETRSEALREVWVDITGTIRTEGHHGGGASIRIIDATQTNIENFDFRLVNAPGDTLFVRGFFEARNCGGIVHNAGRRAIGDFIEVFKADPSAPTTLITVRSESSFPRDSSVPICENVTIRTMNASIHVLDRTYSRSNHPWHLELR